MKTRVEKWISDYTSIEIDFFKMKDEPNLLKVDMANSHLIWIDADKKEDFLNDFVELLKKYYI